MRAVPNGGLFFLPYNLFYSLSILSRPFDSLLLQCAKTLTCCNDHEAKGRAELLHTWHGLNIAAAQAVVHLTRAGDKCGESHLCSVAQCSLQ